MDKWAALSINLGVILDILVDSMIKEMGIFHFDYATKKTAPRKIEAKRLHPYSRFMICNLAPPLALLLRKIVAPFSKTAPGWSHFGCTFYLSVPSKTGLILHGLYFVMQNDDYTCSKMNFFACELDS